MLLVIDSAESRLDDVLYPFPDPDIVRRMPGSGNAADIQVQIGDRCAVVKLYLDDTCSPGAVRAFAQPLAHPYQVFVDPHFSEEAELCRTLSMLSGANPFTPFEVIFLAPRRLPDRHRLLASIRLQRPHFLDVEQRYLFSQPGNRAVVFTLVSEHRQPRFRGEMERQLF